jgi:hypothetical protein
MEECHELNGRQEPLREKKPCLKAAIVLITSEPIKESIRRTCIDRKCKNTTAKSAHPRRVRRLCEARPFNLEPFQPAHIK